MSPSTEAEDRRLARLHLRLGSLALARAELEDLGRRDELGVPGLADLAEARWRSGDLAGAAAAAAAHLAAGGVLPIARVIAAEAAATAGQPEEARSHVDALGVIDAASLDHLFAGMPRRAFWPSAPVTSQAGEGSLVGVGPGTAIPDLAPGGDAGPAGTRERGAAPDAGGEQLATAGFWADEEPIRPRRSPSRGRRRPARVAEPADPATQLARARDEVGSADAEIAARGLERLGLALRQDPALAADVLRAVGPRREAAALLLRGDACRILGLHLEAEAAFAAAAAAIEGQPGARRDA